VPSRSIFHAARSNRLKDRILYNHFSEDEMHTIIRTAHNFVNQQGGATQVPDRFESVTEALERLSECCALHAHEILSCEMDPSVGTTHRIRAAVDLDTQNPGLWVDQVGICTIDMDADPPKNRPKRRRFSPDHEDKRAELKVAKLEQDLAVAEQKKKQPKKPRKKREKKDTEKEEDSQLQPAGAVTMDESGVLPPPMDESGVLRATVHLARAQVRKAFDRLRAPPMSKADTAQRDDSLKLVKSIPQSEPTTPFATSEHRFFANPTSYVRAYETLESVQLHPMLRDALLHCRQGHAIVDTDGVQLIQTTSANLATEKAIKQLRNLMTLPTNGPKALRRILVCAPTNLLVDGAWAMFDPDKMKKNKIVVMRTTPIGRAAHEHKVVDKNLQSYRGKLVVFSTTAGRNTPQLRDLEFEAIILLGAQTTPEYESWALLRGSTRHLDLVSSGGAAVGVEPQNRSLFQRLVAADYPVEE